MRHRIVRGAATLARLPLPAGVDARLQELHRLAACRARAQPRARLGSRREPCAPARADDRRSQSLARAAAAAGGADWRLVHGRRRRAAAVSRGGAAAVARLDEEGAVAAGARATRPRRSNHEPRQLANLVADMLGTREVWLPKLLAGRHRPIAAGGDRSPAARRRWKPSSSRWPRRSRTSTGGPCSPCAGRSPTQAAPRVRPACWRRKTGCRRPRRHQPGAWQALAELLLTAEREPALRKSVGAKQGSSLRRRGSRLAAAQAADEGGARVACRQHESLAGSLRDFGCCRRRHLTDGQWERIDALVAVLPHAVAELLALFAERDSLDHPAVAAAARDALRDDAAPTDLALALDYRIHHLLVDEYQDTSPAQERLLALLLAGWQRGDGRTLFCVGDPMQSIYAFREADVTLFLQAAAQGIGGVPLAADACGATSARAVRSSTGSTRRFASLLPAVDDFERGAVRYSPAEARHEARRATASPCTRCSRRGRARDGRGGRTIAAGALEAARPDPARPSIAILVRGRTVAAGDPVGAQAGRHRLSRHRTRVARSTVPPSATWWRCCAHCCTTATGPPGSRSCARPGVASRSPTCCRWRAASERATVRERLRDSRRCRADRRDARRAPRRRARIGARIAPVMLARQLAEVGLARARWSRDS